MSTKGHGHSLPCDSGLSYFKSFNVSSKATGPIVIKYHVEPLWVAGTKCCSNGSGHTIKMMPRPYGNSLEKSSTDLRDRP